MFSVFTKQLGDYFDRRWILADFFPSLAFWVANLIFAITVIGLDTSLHLWKSLDAGLQTVVTASALAGIAFFAFLLSNVNLTLVRLFEGFWDDTPLLSLLVAFKRAHHQQRWRKLKAEAEAIVVEIQQLEKNAANETAKRTAKEKREQELRLARERFLFYPSDESAVMPTCLGNILRSAELYPFERYGMDAVVLWTRLAPLLPKESSENLADARTAMDFMLNVGALAALLGIVWGVYFALGQQWVFVVLAILALLLCWLAYGNALHAARAYGEIIKTTFDLYRWKLLDALHLSHPKTAQEEPALWEQVNGFVFRGFPLNIAFDPKSAAAKAKDEKD